MKNWKTTAIGIVFGGGWLVFKALVLKQPLTVSDFKDSAGFAALGAFSKDWNVTGGTTEQDKPWWKKIF